MTPAMCVESMGHLDGVWGGRHWARWEGRAGEGRAENNQGTVIFLS